MASGLPIGGDLCSGTTNGNTLPEAGTSFETREVTLGDGTALTSGVQYAIVVRCAADEVEWVTVAGDNYENGSSCLSADGGSSWSIDSGYDNWFQTYAGLAIRDQYGPGDDSHFNPCSGDTWMAQTFTATSSYTITKVKLRLSRWPASTPGTITVSIKATVTGINKIYLGSGGSFLLAATSSGIYLSSDLGETWTQELPDETEGTNWLSGVCSTDGQYIIVEAGAGTIYRSANTGSTWAEITPASSDTFTINDMAISETGKYVLIVGLNATDATKSCYLSDDYGATWTAIYPVDASIEWEQCDISLDGADLIVSNEGGNVYVSSDSGTTWVEQDIDSTSNTWSCLAVSGDGTLKIIANTADVDEVFKNGSNYSVPTWAESIITSVGRALLDDTTQAAQQTTLGLGTTDSPTFTGLTLSGLTASQFVITSADKALASLAVPLTVPYGGTGVTTVTNHGLLLGSGAGAITPLAEATNGQIPIGSTGNDPVLATITGTAKRVTVVNTAGVITLSGPQDIDTVDSPTFAGITSTGVIDASAGEVLTEDNDTSEPEEKDDGYIGVAIIDGTARVYFAVDGTMYYIDGTIVEAAEIVTGNPIGLLLALTYNME